MAVVGDVVRIISPEEYEKKIGCKCMEHSPLVQFHNSICYVKSIKNENCDLEPIEIIDRRILNNDEYFESTNIDFYAWPQRALEVINYKDVEINENELDCLLGVNYV